jgi:hypothetical protein
MTSISKAHWKWIRVATEKWRSQYECICTGSTDDTCSVTFSRNSREVIDAGEWKSTDEFKPIGEDYKDKLAEVLQQLADQVTESLGD